MTTWIIAAIALFSLAVAAGSLLVAIMTYNRNGRWKDSDEAKEIAKSLKDISQEQNDQGDRITSLEERTKEVATKSDMNGLRREIESLEKLMSAKVDGVREQNNGMRSDLSEIKKWMMREPS